MVQIMSEQKHILPLAERLRPKTLSDVMGQEHLTAPNAVLYQAVQNKKIPSIIFWGPPGVGKTTLARILSKESDLQFFSLSAIDAGVKEIRAVIETAGKLGKALLFIDEIHRFNKSQQDSLLAAVEKGIITLIGATTENPSFEVNNALLSRCQVYILKELEQKDLVNLLHHAITHDEILKTKHIEIQEHDALIYFSGGDARKLLNLLEIIVDVQNTDSIIITNELVKNVLQNKQALYDKNGEIHYDIISAFIKSMRGSDPNAALFYLARMILAGEDPKFIARRMLILASEDIGNANPTALIMANTCFDAVSKIGYPECDLILSQTVIYLASSPKSNASYTAIAIAKKLVKDYEQSAVPLHLRNAPTKLMKSLNYGTDYKYAHEYEGNFAEQEFLPSEISGTQIYNPGLNARENELRNYLKKCWKEKYNY
jgi:putative ATPase